MVTGNTAALAGAALLWLAAAAPARADSPDASYHAGLTGDEYTAYAEVVQVSPRYGWREVSEPVRQCVDVDRYAHYEHPRYRHRYHRRHGGGDAAAGLVGGLIGGLIGHQFGGGNGKTALTVAGAALGASIARDHVQRSGEYRYAPLHERTVRRCTETWHTRRVRDTDGYDVTYRYQGHTFHKWMNEHPGDTVAVSVAVEPWQAH